MFLWPFGAQNQEKLRERLAGRPLLPSIAAMITTTITTMILSMYMAATTDCAIIRDYG